MVITSCICTLKMRSYKYKEKLYTKTSNEGAVETVFDGASIEKTCMSQHMLSKRVKAKQGLVTLRKQVSFS